MSVVSKYNRISPFYDLLELPIELLLYAGWRKEVLSNLSGKVLEVGIGTGRNLKYYPPSSQVTGIDASKGMLEKARYKVGSTQNIELLLMDSEHLEFPDNTFDYAVITFVLCSTPDPMRALKEIRRVLKPSGELIALEHTYSSNRLLARFEVLINPIMSLVLADDMTRDTVDNIKKAGFDIKEEKNLALKDVFKYIRAGP